MRRLRDVCLSVLFSLALLEGLFWVIDPLGQVYHDDLRTFRAHTLPDETGYALPDGTITLSSWQASHKGGRRFVPDSVPTGKTVYFTGDSVTYGYGVNDGETWVNLLAKEFSLNAINLGKPAYNIGNIHSASLAIPDRACVVYVIVSNDNQASTRWYPVDAGGFTYRTAGAVYELLRRFQVGAPPLFDDTVKRLIAQMEARLRVFGVQLDGDFGVGYPVIRIPETERISFLDRHFTAQGNRTFFEAVKEEFEQWVKGC